MFSVWILEPRTVVKQCHSCSSALSSGATVLRTPLTLPSFLLCLFLLAHVISFRSCVLILSESRLASVYLSAPCTRELASFCFCFYAYWVMTAHGPCYLVQCFLNVSCIPRHACSRTLFPFTPSRSGCVSIVQVCHWSLLWPCLPHLVHESWAVQIVFCHAHL